MQSHLRRFLVAPALALALLASVSATAFGQAMPGTPIDPNTPHHFFLTETGFATLDGQVLPIVGAAPVPTWDFSGAGFAVFSGDLVLTTDPGNPDADSDIVRFVPNVAGTLLSTQIQMFSDNIGGSEPGDLSDGPRPEALDNTFRLAEDPSETTLYKPVPGNTTYTIQSDTTPPVPEPCTLSLLGTGALSMFGSAWRRRKNAA